MRFSATKAANSQKMTTKKTVQGSIVSNKKTFLTHTALNVQCKVISRLSKQEIQLAMLCQVLLDKLSSLIKQA